MNLIHELHFIFEYEDESGEKFKATKKMQTQSFENSQNAFSFYLQKFIKEGNLLEAFYFVKNYDNHNKKKLISRYPSNEKP